MKGVGREETRRGEFRLHDNDARGVPEGASISHRQGFNHFPLQYQNRSPQVQQQ